MSYLNWESPDGKIKKKVISLGDTKKFKPTEGTECKLKISDASEDLSEYSSIVIGDVDSDFGRQFEICVTMLFEKEISEFIVNLDKTYTFTLELLEMKFSGFLYEWDAKRKFDYAVFQNEKGKAHFSKGNFREAGFRFNKGIKIVTLIPIDAENPPEYVDGVSIKDINQLKATFYNNLASCFFKKEQWSLVIDFCDKVFLYDKENVKALYRAAIAYIKDRNFEKADDYLRKVIEKEPNNKSALEYHKFVKENLKEAKEKSNKMVRKMIGDILKV